MRPYVRPFCCKRSRWPSWVFAYVSGTKLNGVLQCTRAQSVFPELLLIADFPHHVSQCMLPVLPGDIPVSRASLPNIMPRRHDGHAGYKLLCGSIAPRQCAQFYWPERPSPDEQDGAQADLEAICPPRYAIWALGRSSRSRPERAAFLSHDCPPS